MFRVLMLIVSTLAPIFIAKALNGSIETSKALTANAIDKISARIFKQMTWTLIGISFLSTGVILAALESAEVWGVAFTATLGVKIGLALVGGVCLYVGLRRPEDKVVELEEQRSQQAQGIDWQEILTLFLTKLKTPAEPTATNTNYRGTPGNLSPEDLDRIVAALRQAQNPTSNQTSNHRSGSRQYNTREPDLTAH